MCRADANASASRTRLAVGCVYEADSCTLDPVGCATLPTQPPVDPCAKGPRSAICSRPDGMRPLPCADQRYLKVLKQNNLASWSRMVDDWADAPQELRDERDALRSKL